MATDATLSRAPSDQDVHSGRLFAGSCVALLAVSTNFAAIAGAMFQLKDVFLLTNQQVGLIGGAAMWGLALGQVIFAPLCDRLGLKLLLRLAFFGHLSGVLVMVTASGFWQLFLGAALLSVANGIVEAACNPLVAALYPTRKTVMLNRFHLWFPGGIAIGGLSIWLLDVIGLTDWRLKILIVLIPTVAYGWMLLRETFPPTEANAAGMRVKDTFLAVLTSPLMWVLLGLMAITASIELGPNRWIPAVLQAGGMAGILVLVLINGVMAVVRANSHFILDRVSPPLLMTGATILAACGLFALSFGGGLAATLTSALIFALGVSLMWPTMVGLVSERLPQTGALGLGLIAAVGALVVGVFTTPILGQIADDRLPHTLDAAATTQVLAAAASGERGAPSS